MKALATLNSLLLCALSVVLIAPPAMAGNEGAHGGDPYSLEFITIGTLLADQLSTEFAQNPALFEKWKFKPDDIRKAIDAVRVVSNEGDEVILNGNEVDAINIPAQNLIQLNRTRWRSADLASRTRLVLHEYFGIVGGERDKFTASIDFKGFTSRALEGIRASIGAENLLANLFYGRCLSFPSLNESTTCDFESPKLQQAERCAITQAEGNCKISGKKNCEKINISYSAQMSPTQIGLRFCEVLVVLK